MKIKLKIDNPTELLFVLRALEDRRYRVYHSDTEWEAWELTVQKKLIEQVRKLAKKWGVR